MTETTRGGLTQQFVEQEGFVTDSGVVFICAVPDCKNELSEFEDAFCVSCIARVNNIPPFEENSLYLGPVAVAGGAEI